MKREEVNQYHLAKKRKDGKIWPKKEMAQAEEVIQNRSQKIRLRNR